MWGWLTLLCPACLTSPYSASSYHFLVAIDKKQRHPFPLLIALAISPEKAGAHAQARQKPGQDLYGCGDEEVKGTGEVRWYYKSYTMSVASLMRED